MVQSRIILSIPRSKKKTHSPLYVTLYVYIRFESESQKDVPVYALNRKHLKNKKHNTQLLSEILTFLQRQSSILF